MIDASSPEHQSSWPVIKNVLSSFISLYFCIKWIFSHVSVTVCFLQHSIQIVWTFRDIWYPKEIVVTISYI